MSSYEDAPNSNVNAVIRSIESYPSMLSVVKVMKFLYRRKSSSTSLLFGLLIVAVIMHSSGDPLYPRILAQQNH